MIKAVILTAFILLGAPWEKNVDKIDPEPTVAEIATVAENATTELSGIPEQPEWTHSATCTITHYCNCARCCGQWVGGPTASGVMPEAGRTVAVDSSVIPLGSEVLIGDHIYIAEDTGVSGYWVDIFCDSHSEALQRGMYSAEVCWR